jgi:hypothetical protein
MSKAKPSAIKRKAKKTQQLPGLKFRGLGHKLKNKKTAKKSPIQTASAMLAIGRGLGLNL